MEGLSEVKVPKQANEYISEVYFLTPSLFSSEDLLMTQGQDRCSIILEERWQRLQLWHALEYVVLFGPTPKLQLPTMKQSVKLLQCKDQPETSKIFPIDLEL